VMHPEDAEITPGLVVLYVPMEGDKLFGPL
jgi:hypothetical protein